MSDIPSYGWVYAKASAVGTVAAFVILACVYGMTFAMKTAAIATVILLFACSLTAIAVSLLFAISDARRNMARRKHRQGRIGPIGNGK